MGAGPDTGLNILVIDDETMIQDFFARLAGARGWQGVDKAASGEEALNRVLRQVYDLITVDLEDGSLVFRKETGVTSWEELESLGPFPESRWAREDLGVRDDGGEKKEIVEEVGRVLANAGAFSGAED